MTAGVIQSKMCVNYASKVSVMSRQVPFYNPMGAMRSLWCVINKFVVVGAAWRMNK